MELRQGPLLPHERTSDLTICFSGRMILIRLIRCLAHEDCMNTHHARRNVDPLRKVCCSLPGESRRPFVKGLAQICDIPGHENSLLPIHALENHADQILRTRLVADFGGRGTTRPINHRIFKWTEISEAGWEKATDRLPTRCHIHQALSSRRAEL